MHCFESDQTPDRSIRLKKNRNIKRGHMRDSTNLIECQGRVEIAPHASDKGNEEEATAQRREDVVQYTL